MMTRTYITSFLLAFFCLWSSVKAQTLDCDCSPTVYVFDVDITRGCATQILTGMDRNAIPPTGVSCSADQITLPNPFNSGDYEYVVTIKGENGNDIEEWNVDSQALSASTFQFSFEGKFEDPAAEIIKSNYASVLFISILIREDANDLGTMDATIPYTGVCNQLVFSGGDRIGWLTYVSIRYR